MLSTINDIFWSTNFWLPSKLTWDDLEKDGKSIMPSCWDLWICIPVSIILYLIRCQWEKYVATPIGRLFHLQEKVYKASRQNEIIDSLVRKYKNTTSDEVITLCAKETQWTKRQVQRYIRKSKRAHIPSQLTKFTETTWKFIFFLFIFCYGLWSLWDKDWLTDPKLCWIGWPLEHNLPKEIYWYYMLECGFYIFSSVSLCFDVKRKDFVEMIVHHIATIVLLFCSYCDNMHRMGSLVMIIHDSCDVIMESAKMAKYLKYQRLCDCLFVTFTLLWLITRLIIYPFSILKISLFDAPNIVSHLGEKPNIYYFMNLMMCTLQLLHIIWFYFICQIVYDVAVKGHVQKDSRSESDSSDCDVPDKHYPSNGIHNNSQNGYVNVTSQSLYKSD